MQFDEVIDLLKHNPNWDSNAYDKWILLSWDFFLKNRQNHSYIPSEQMSKIHGILNLMRNGVTISVKQRFLLGKTLVEYQQDLDPMKAYF